MAISINSFGGSASAQISYELTDGELSLLQKVEGLQHVQIDDYLPTESLIKLNRVFAERGPDVQFRIYGFHFPETPCDLDFLKYLKDLKSLSVDVVWTALNVERIRDLKKLETLNIEIQTLSDFDFLDGVNPGLRVLGLATGKENNKFDLERLLQFPGLEDISLHGVGRDISSFLKLKKLEKLFIRTTKITDLSPINDMNIKELALWFGSKYDFDALRGNKTIRFLSLQRVRSIDNLDVLGSFSNLETLDTWQLSKVEQVPNLRNNAKLTEITFDGLSRMRDISELAYVPNLKKLSLYNMKKLMPEDLEFILQNESLEEVRWAVDYGKNKEFNALIEERGLNPER